jgi:hypothetical protein
MPKADFFKDQDIPIQWDATKAKRPGSASGREYAKYSKATTTRQLFAMGGSRHFHNDLVRGIFLFVDDKYRALQQAAIDDHAAESVAQRTRVRGPVTSLTAQEQTFVNSEHGGDDIPLNSLKPSIPEPTKLDPVHYQFINQALFKANAHALNLSEETYTSIAESFVDNFGDKPSHVAGSSLADDDDSQFFCLHSDSYAAAADTNETLTDQMLFWLTDESVTEFVISLEPETTEPSHKLSPDDIRINELLIRELNDYSGDDRIQMIKAITKEIHDLVSLGTFEWCRLPDNRRPISSRLVLKIKYKADGELDKYKGCGNINSQRVS